MDSINRNQPEDNRKDLSAEAAATKIRELVEDSPNCFFCTQAARGSGGARPMNVRRVDADGNLWFLSANDSRKNKELEADPNVQLYFKGSAHSDFMQLNGRATISTDQGTIRELWEPIIKTWFTEGVSDPRITVIKVEPSDGYYWDTKHGNAVAGIKMLIGSVLGKTLDDSIEGKLRV
jgi:general stress protein 26